MKKNRHLVLFAACVLSVGVIALGFYSTVIIDILNQILQFLFGTVVLGIVLPIWFAAFGIIYSRFKDQIENVEFRKYFIPFWTTSKPIDRYRHATSAAEDVFELIRKRRIAQFPKAVILYSLFFYFIFWIAGSQGQFLTLQILPSSDSNLGSIILRLLSFIIFLTCLFKYKLLIGIHKSISTDGFAVTAGITLACLLLIHFLIGTDFEFIFIWAILCMCSPISMSVATALLIASSIGDVIGLQVATVTVVALSIISYLTAYEKEQQHLFISLIVLVASLYAIVFTYNWTDLYSTYQPAFSEQLSQAESIPVLMLTLVLIIVFIIDPKFILAIPVLGLFAFALFTIFRFVLSSLLNFYDKLFPNENECYIFNPEILGGIAIILIVPLANLLFDYASFYITKFILSLYSLVNDKVKKATPIHLSLFFVDIFISVGMIGLLIITMCSSLAYFESKIRTDKCTVSFDESSLGTLISNPISIDSGWLMLVVFTTLIWTCLHGVIALSAYAALYINDKKIRVSLAYLSSKFNNPKTNHDIALWHSLIVCVSIPILFALTFGIAMLFANIVLSGYFDFMLSIGTSFARELY